MRFVVVFYDIPKIGMMNKIKLLQQSDRTKFSIHINAIAFRGDDSN
ncbi:hypothetical protein [Cylindrospermopsis curvispora]|uniref:Uncharacterized protein n=1 Tax=Cylindrospermopsis curvispora GIHE-G1 TaxID=2666332 RepID=A0A7H0EZ87_9CYAN|nr:hypothetical protein [Cylindrospermopsis curvispora]QNP29103.1 hypothetical protein IAR63_14845 [Cylindrospermopsis curvispora GIHE-G1]